MSSTVNDKDSIKIPNSSRRILVLYGSQTGTAEEVAERIGREGKRRHLKVDIEAMDDYDKERLSSERLVIFVCSTTGQGEEPDNMKKFWKSLLRKTLPVNMLSQTKYAVFGLGDSSYTKFNFPAKKLFKRLNQLGAQPLCPRGDGDDQHPLGLDGGLDPWLKTLWDEVLRMFPLAPDQQIFDASVLSPASFAIEFVGDNAKSCSAESEDDSHFATVVANNRITSNDHFQDVRHIELQFDEKLEYSPGDILVVAPRNLPEDVQEFIDFFGWQNIADKSFRLRTVNADEKLRLKWSNVLTLRTVLERYLDIFGRPRRYFFELLSHFTTDEDHSAKLREFASAEGQDDLYSYCYRPRRTAFEVLQDFHSVKFPPDYLFDLFPTIRPRSFSISSSPMLHGNTLHLTVGIVEYKTRLKKMRQGICTKWMRTLNAGSRVESLKIQQGTMKMANFSSPVICIATGTGIAPMRSIIHERCSRSEAAKTVLIFGCRYSQKDCHYQVEFEEYAKQGKLDTIFACSRDQEAKIYIQHQIRNNSALIWDLVHNNGAYLYLSGSSTNIPDEVAAALVDAFAKEGGLTETEAKAYLTDLERKGRFQQECWS